MKKSGNLRKAVVIALLSLFVLSQTVEAGRGGSFGGSRGGSSFGGSRGGSSFGGSRGGSSFGGSKSAPSATPQAKPATPTPQSNTMTAPRSGGSFGGARSPVAAESYRKSYGIPRKSEPISVPNSGGGSSNYMVHSYGGWGDSFTMGYIAGRTSMWWYTPFHPAFYYSRPVYVTAPDGSMEVYPSSFSWMITFFMILVVGGVVFIIYVFIRNRRRRNFSSVSSFS